MVQYCVAYGCRESSSRGTSVSFHSFPSDENLRKKWELSLGRGTFQASKHSRLCSKHFAPECFDMEAFGKGRGLKKGSVPSIFDFSEHLQTQLVKRQAPKERVAGSYDFCVSDISTVVDEVRNATMRCGTSCEIDTSIEIKEEDPFSDMSQDEREFFPKDDVTETKCNAGHLSDECNITIKTEAPCPELYLRKEIEFFPMKVEQYSNDEEVNSKVEVKEDCWLETSYAGISSVYDEIEDGVFHPVKSPRLCTEAVSDDSGESPLPSAADSGRDTSFCNDRDHAVYTSQESNDTKTLAQFGEHSTGGEINSRALHLEQKYLIHKSKRTYKCDICEKRFSSTSNLKRHKLIHGNERPHTCDICARSFTNISHLKRHKFIHGGKRPHKCEICDKSFIQLSLLKLHNLIHDGRKPHKCAICEKSFTQLWHLKEHNLIHEGKKQHKCEICEKRFTRLSHLKRHNSIHQHHKVIQV